MPGFQILGRGVIKADGVAFANDVDFTLELGGTRRMPETDALGKVYFRKMTEPSKLDFNLMVNAGTSLKTIQAIEGTDLTVEADTGQSWTIPAAWCADVPSLSGSNGRAKITFQGGEAQEVVS